MSDFFALPQTKLGQLGAVAECCKDVVWPQLQCPGWRKETKKGHQIIFLITLAFYMCPPVGTSCKLDIVYFYNSKLYSTITLHTPKSPTSIPHPNIGIPVSRWDLGVSQNYSSSPICRGQFLWKKRMLWKGGYGIVPLYDPCPPQTQFPNLQDFPNLDLTTVPHITRWWPGGAGNPIPDT